MGFAKNLIDKLKFKEMEELEDQRILETKLRRTKLIFAIIAITVVILLGWVTNVYGIIDPLEETRDCSICGITVNEDLTHCDKDIIDPFEIDE